MITNENGEPLGIPCEHCYSTNTTYASEDMWFCYDCNKMTEN